MKEPLREKVMLKGKQKGSKGRKSKNQQQRRYTVRFPNRHLALPR